MHSSTVLVGQSALVRQPGMADRPGRTRRPPRVRPGHARLVRRAVLGPDPGRLPGDRAAGGRLAGSGAAAPTASAARARLPVRRRIPGRGAGRCPRGARRRVARPGGSRTVVDRHRRPGPAGLSPCGPEGSWPPIVGSIGRLPCPGCVSFPLPGVTETRACRRASRWIQASCPLHRSRVHPAAPTRCQAAS